MSHGQKWAWRLCTCLEIVHVLGDCARARRFARAWRLSTCLEICTCLEIVHVLGDCARAANNYVVLCVTCLHCTCPVVHIHIESENRTITSVR